MKIRHRSNTVVVGLLSLSSPLFRIFVFLILSFASRTLLGVHVWNRYTVISDLLMNALRIVFRFATRNVDFVYSRVDSRPPLMPEIQTNWVTHTYTKQWHKNAISERPSKELLRIIVVYLSISVFATPGSSYSILSLSASFFSAACTWLHSQQQRSGVHTDEGKLEKQILE